MLFDGLVHLAPWAGGPRRHSVRVARGVRVSCPASPPTHTHTHTHIRLREIRPQRRTPSPRRRWRAAAAAERARAGSRRSRRSSSLNRRLKTSSRRSSKIENDPQSRSSSKGSSSKGSSSTKGGGNLSHRGSRTCRGHHGARPGNSMAAVRAARLALAGCASRTGRRTRVGEGRARTRRDGCARGALRTTRHSRDARRHRRGVPHSHGTEAQLARGRARLVRARPQAAL